MNKFTLLLKEALVEAVDLYREYALLKAMHKLTGKPIRFEDFDELTYRVIPDRQLMILMHNKLGLNKIIKFDDLRNNDTFGPSTFADFIDINGGIEVDGSGKVVSSARKYNKSGSNYHAPSDKKVWKQMGPLGFWKEVPVGA